MCMWQAAGAVCGASHGRGAHALTTVSYAQVCLQHKLPSKMQAAAASKQLLCYLLVAAFVALQVSTAVCLCETVDGLQQRKKASRGPASCCYTSMPGLQTCPSPNTCVLCAGLCVAAVVLQVLVAVRDTVWVVDDHGATDQPLPAGCGGVAAMAVSPNGTFVALSCNDGKLRVMTSGEWV